MFAVEGLVRVESGRAVGSRAPWFVAQHMCRGLHPGLRHGLPALADFRLATPRRIGGSDRKPAAACKRGTYSQEQRLPGSEVG